MHGIALIAALLAAPVAAAEETPPLPGWMAGCWEQVEGERWTEECWTAPRAGTMLGSSRSGRGDTLIEWETMQILPGDAASGPGPVFWGSPRGAARTAFAWRPDAGPGIAFVNAAHDYPQRIRYWREGENLIAEIALADGSKPRRWTYRPRR